MHRRLQLPSLITPEVIEEADVTFFGSAESGNTATNTVGVPVGSVGKMALLLAGYFSSTDIEFITPARTKEFHYNFNGWDLITAKKTIASEAETQIISTNVPHLLCLVFDEANTILAQDVNIAAAGSTAGVFPALPAAPHDGCLALNILLFNSANSDAVSNSNTNAIEVTTNIRRTSFPGRRGWKSPSLQQGEVWPSSNIAWTNVEAAFFYSVLIGRT